MKIKFLGDKQQMIGIDDFIFDGNIVKSHIQNIPDKLAEFAIDTYPDLFEKVEKKKKKSTPKKSKKDKK
tara:strand:+ start:270 stop:476 length:207 start_codon:yes stop_codon:yes gene_type:complete